MSAAAFRILGLSAATTLVLPETGRAAGGDAGFYQSYPGVTWILATVTGLLICVLVVLVFCTRRRLRVEAKLRSSEARFRELFENIHDGVWMVELPTGKALYASPAQARLFGENTTDPDAVFAARQARVHPQDQARIAALLEPDPAQDQREETYRIVLPSGEERWLVDRAHVIRDADGSPRRVAGTTENITERRITEAALEESRRAMSTLLSNLPGIAYRCRNDREWTMAFVSEGCFDLTGYAAADLENNRKLAYAELIHPDDRAGVWRDVQHAVDRRRPFVVTYRIITAAGAIKWVWEMGRGVFSDDGELLALEGFIAADDDRQKALRALRESEERYRTLVEKSPIPIVIHVEEKLVFANAAAASALGADEPQQLIGKSIWELTDPSSHDVIRDRVKRIYAETIATPVIEERFRRLDGEVVDVEVSGSTILYGGVRASQVVFTDISQRKRAEAERTKLEAQLRQSQKMEAVGQLAGGVAHDFNNILTAIVGYLGLARDALAAEVPADHTGMRGLREVEKAAERAAALTRRLLIFSRKEVVQPHVFDLNRVLRETQQMLRRLISENIELDFDLADDLHPIRADAGQIEQVILNLVVNARDAMPNGGRLEVTTRNASVADRDIRALPDAAPGPHVILAVRDTGTGMEPDTAERIFEPFFTTKDVGQGSGLGLSIVHGIVRQAGGHIEVDSQPGAGTTMRIFLPATLPDALEDLPGEEEIDQTLTGDETVLVCEDDPTVRELASRILQHAGYTVLSADHGAAAQDLARQHAGPLHLLLTDVIMPAMNGRQLAETLSEQRPEMRTLYISGYTSDVIANHGVLDEGIDFLEKPFNRKTLLERVRDVLHGDPTNPSTPSPDSETT
jgi:two-component system cell cycle sensor histidine kinase/response regulator CckA